MWLYPIFNWFSSNKYAKWIVLGVAGLFFIKLDHERIKGKVRKQTNQKRDIKQATQTAKIETETNQKITEIVNEERKIHERAVEARDNAIAPDDFDELPKHIREGYTR